MSKHCLLCGQAECTKMDEGDRWLIDCKTYGAKVYISHAFIEDHENELIFDEALNLIVEKIIRASKSPRGDLWYFYYTTEPLAEIENPATINLAVLLKNYPNTVTDILNRTLLNLTVKHSTYGSEVLASDRYYRRYYVKGKNVKNRAEAIANMMVEFGYLNPTSNHYEFIISANGWKKADELRQKLIATKQAFVAMSFAEETKPIREAFRQAISESGYTARIIDEKEHNNQIVPEIFYEIEKSKFIVVDVTYPNYGAYYEAGYAQGLGKEVIVCCRKDVFKAEEKKPHFDISQKSMIVWETEEELAQRLIKRIEATVQ